MKDVLGCKRNHTTFYTLYVAIFFRSTQERVIICWLVFSGNVVDIVLTD